MSTGYEGGKQIYSLQIMKDDYFEQRHLNRPKQANVYWIHVGEK